MVSVCDVGLCMELFGVHNVYNYVGWCVMLVCVHVMVVCVILVGACVLVGVYVCWLMMCVCVCAMLASYLVCDVGWWVRDFGV